MPGGGVAVVKSAWSLILYPLLRQGPSRLVRLDFVTLREFSIVIDSQALVSLRQNQHHPMRFRGFGADSETKPRGLC